MLIQQALIAAQNSTCYAAATPPLPHPLPVEVAFPTKWGTGQVTINPTLTTDNIWQHVNFPTSTAYSSRLLRNHGEPSLELVEIIEKRTCSKCLIAFSQDNWKTLDNDQDRHFKPCTACDCRSMTVTRPWPCACCSCCSTSGHAGATTSMSSSWSCSRGTKYGERKAYAGHEMPWAPANVSSEMYRWTYHPPSVYLLIDLSIYIIYLSN